MKHHLFSCEASSTFHNLTVTQLPLHINHAEDFWALKIGRTHFRMDKVVFKGIVDMKDMVDNMDMVDKMNMVDNIGKVILQKTHGYLNLTLQDR